MRKMMAMILALAMMVMVIPTAGALAETGGAIFDFTDADTVASLGFAQDKSVVCTKEVSAKWNNPQANTQIMLSLAKTIDMTKYKYLNQWIYSEKANNQVVNIVVYNEQSKYKLYQKTIDFEGWQLVSIPTAQISAGAGNISAAVRVDYNIDGWGAKPLSDTAINFDKIWLSDTAEAAAPVITELPVQNGQSGVTNKTLEFKFDKNVMEVVSPAIAVVKYTADGVTAATTDYSVFGKGSSVYLVFDKYVPEAEYSVTLNGITGEYGAVSGAKAAVSFTVAETEIEKTYIANFDNEDIIVAYGLEADTNITLHNSMTAKWDIPAKADTAIVNNIPADWTDFETVNILMYSPQASGAKISVVPRLADGKYMLGFVKLDWEGSWKVVSIPTSSFVSAWNGNFDKVRYFALSSTGWNVSSTTPDTVLNIDRIWFSKTAGADAAVIKKAPSQNGAALDVTNKVFEFKTSGQTYEYAEPADVTVTCNGEQVKDYSVYGDGSKVVVAFDENLKYGSDYVITVSNVKNSVMAESEGAMSAAFTTEAEGGFSVSASALNESEGRYTLSALAVNNTNENRAVTAAIASYDADGNIKEVSYKVFAVNRGSECNVIADIASEGHNIVKGFVWDENMKPYTQEPLGKNQ